jgi:hypothetical protein
MTQEHPVTPPPELRRLLAQQAQRVNPHDPVEWMQYVSEKAAQWGADTELEACCEWIESELRGQLRPAWRIAKQLRAARRPKPKSEKQQALEAFDRIEYAPSEAEDFAIILRALQSIPDEQ